MKPALSKAHIQDLLHTLYSMAFLVEARDRYTGGHLWRVSQFSTRLALASDLSKQQAVVAGLGGFLHDLGKVGVPDSILNNTGKLSDDEYAVMKTHPELGAQVLQGHPLASLAMDAVLGHHERIDGRGYPAGLTGSDMSDTAKIVGLADAFDAMTSTRPYRQGMAVDAAIEQISQHLDTQFDQTFGLNFIALAKSGELDGIIGHSEAGIPMHNCPMCGPVVVVHKYQKAGDAIFCRVCGNGFSLQKQHGEFTLKPTGKLGTAHDLQANIDHDLLGRLLEEALPYLSVDSNNIGVNWLQRLRNWL